MMYERDDDLDRLLFSMPLEEPPPDLRAAILRATIYRPAFALRPWEIWMLGTVAALTVWLAALIIGGGAEAFIRTVSIVGANAARVLAAQSTWLWIAAGVGATFWLSILNLTPMPLQVFERYARR